MIFRFTLNHIGNTTPSSSNSLIFRWTYKNVNAVFYNPDGAPLTDAEKVELAKKERKINLENTRFTSNPWKSDVQNANVKHTAAAQQEAKVKYP